MDKKAVLSSTLVSSSPPDEQDLFRNFREIKGHRISTLGTFGLAIRLKYSRSLVQISWKEAEISAF